jgi:hypothetical protein
MAQPSGADDRFLADATISRRGHEGLLRVEPGGSIVVERTAGIGAELPLPEQSTNAKNCPKADLCLGPRPDR